MLSQPFKPMATQLSKKAVLPLAEILATESCRSSEIGPCLPEMTKKYPIAMTGIIEAHASE